MGARERSTSSPTRSSPARSKAGSGATVRARTVARTLGVDQLVERLARDDFPAALYLDGPDEGIKAALLAEYRLAWARACPETPAARVFGASETSVDELLAAYHGGSLFAPRELLLVLDVEHFGRSEKRIAALAEGLARPTSGTCAVLVESAAETERKSLSALRAACTAHVTALPPSRSVLLSWGKRRATRDRIAVEPGVMESVVEACEGDAIAFFDELEKLCAWAGPGGRVSATDLATLMRPVAGADLPGYLAAVATGDSATAGRRLGRLLAAGVGEGTVLFALANLVGGALGGWARHRELSGALRQRIAPRELARALDAVYRAEAAWKGGRADVLAVLEQATRVVAAAD